MDMLNDCKWHCVEDSLTYRKMMDKDRVYDFLAGLNKDLDEVRGRLLGIRPLLAIGEIFSEVRREKSQKRVMLGDSKPLSTTENSALAARGLDTWKDTRVSRKGGNLWCDHCKKPHYTRDNYWKLHGKPENWKENRGNNRDTKGFQTTTEGNRDSKEEGNRMNVSLTKEQMEQLY